MRMLTLIVVLKSEASNIARKGYNSYDTCFSLPLNRITLANFELLVKYIKVEEF